MNVTYHSSLITVLAVSDVIPPWTPFEWVCYAVQLVLPQSWQALSSCQVKLS